MESLSSLENKWNLSQAGPKRMYANQLKKLIKSDAAMAKVFCGILAKDQLPVNVPTTTTTKDCAYIVNTDESDEQGQHWLLLYCSAQHNVLYYIDPLGNPPKHYNGYLTKFASKFQKIIKLPYAVQGGRSRLCGLFVMYYLYYLARGYSDIEKISSTFFKAGLGRNDRIVLKFFWKMFRFCPKKLLYKCMNSVK